MTEEKVKCLNCEFEFKYPLTLAAEVCCGNCHQWHQVVGDNCIIAIKESEPRDEQG